MVVCLEGPLPVNEEEVGGPIGQRPREGPGPLSDRPVVSTGPGERLPGVGPHDATVPTSRGLVEVAPRLKAHLGALGRLLSAPLGLGGLLTVADRLDVCREVAGRVVEVVLTSPPVLVGPVGPPEECRVVGLESLVRAGP